jgi:hypothetical protein
MMDSMKRIRTDQAVIDVLDLDKLSMNGQDDLLQSAFVVRERLAEKRKNEDTIQRSHLQTPCSEYSKDLSEQIRIKYN